MQVRVLPGVLGGVIHSLATHFRADRLHLVEYGSLTNSGIATGWVRIDRNEPGLDRRAASLGEWNRIAPPLETTIQTLHPAIADAHEKVSAKQQNTRQDKRVSDW
ncbi:MAG: hypothetical protein H6808_06575 [Phycisphaera sp.]|nr:hypothetical protein [Phycisphaera sp.]